MTFDQLEAAIERDGAQCRLTVRLGVHGLMAVGSPEALAAFGRGIVAEAERIINLKEGEK